MFIIIILPIKKNLINQLDHCDNNVLSRNILAERQVMGMTHHGKMGKGSSVGKFLPWDTLVEWWVTGISHHVCSKLLERD